MQILASHLPHMSILTYHDGRLLGRVGEPIVDPASLEVIALRAILPESEHKQPVLMMRDICDTGQGYVMIGSTEDIDDASEIVRVKQILDTGWNMLRKPVVTQSGQRLGTSYDFSFSSTSFGLQRLHVKRPLWASLVGGNLIIDRSQIIEVTSKRFVVRDSTIKAKLLPAPQPAKPLA